MKIPDQPLTLQKEEAAIRHAEAAIAALQHGHFDIAVTLAGAAEGIYSDRKGSDIHTQMMKQPKALERFNPKEWNAVLNLERDWLKHVSDHGMSEITISAWLAAFSVARALSKLDADAWTPLMHEFREWLLSNRDALFQK
ncbi:hypothetical protein ACERNI_09080 [Camelimonas sp. ID_303_24]